MVRRETGRLWKVKKDSFCFSTFIYITPLKHLWFKAKILRDVGKKDSPKDNEMSGWTQHLHYDIFKSVWERIIMPKCVLAGTKAGTRYTVIFRTWQAGQHWFVPVDSSTLSTVGNCSERLSPGWLLEWTPSNTICTNSLFTVRSVSCSTTYTVPGSVNRWLALQHTAIIMFGCMCDLYIGVSVCVCDVWESKVGQKLWDLCASEGS